MSRTEYVARAVARRPASVGAGIFGLLGAFFVFFLANTFVEPAAWRLTQFDMGTEVYRRAQWASTTALFSFIAVSLSLGVWLVGASLRSFFGLPGRQIPRWLRGLTTLRVLASIVVLIWLALWASDEVLVRRIDWAPVGSLVLGLAITANFAWDVPRLFVDARAALATRLPLLRMPLVPIGALPSSGRVRVRGRIAGPFGERRADAGERAVVYERHVRGLGDDVDERVEALPFLVEDGGAQAVVDAASGTPIVEAVDLVAEQDERFYTRLLTGDRVEVIGHVQGGGDDAYRGGLARISAGSPGEPLLVFANADSMHRRLVVAAVVEMACAALLLACVLGLVAGWTWLRFIAHPDLHKLP